MQKFSEDSEQCLATLGEELKAKVDGFVVRLRGFAQGHSDANRRVIQKNLQRVGQDQARLQGIRCGMETLLLENDPSASSRQDGRTRVSHTSHTPVVLT